MIAPKAPNAKAGTRERAIRRRRSVPPQARTLRNPGQLYGDEAELEVVLNPTPNKGPDLGPPPATPPGPSVSTPPHPGTLDSHKENLELKSLLLAQLDTIQRQSEDICRKDRQLRDLQRENGDLKRRLKDLERTRKSALLDGTEAEPTAASTTPQSQPPRPRSPQLASRWVEPPIIETEELYYCSAGESFVAREREEIAHIRAHAEVPAWRARLLSPSRSGPAEMGEDLTDAHFLKRHAKLEADEKRRKRWDIQRIREQVTIQRLKARYEQPDYLFKPSGTGSSARPPAPDPPTERETIYPDPENITHVCVQGTIPVCAFGLPLPKLPPQEFSIPWLSPASVGHDRTSESSDASGPVG